MSGMFENALANMAANVNKPKQSDIINEVPENVNSIDVYEAWRDPYKGKAYIGRMTNNLGKLEIVDYTFENTGIQYVTFKSGLQIETSKLNDYYSYSEEKSDKSQNEIYRASIENAKKDNIGKELSLKTQSNIEQEQLINKEFIPSNNKKQETIKNPIVNIIRGMKNNPIELNLKISLNIPKKELYDVLSESFDNVYEGITEFLFLQENFKILKESIINSIKSYYNVSETITEATESDPEGQFNKK